MPRVITLKNTPHGFSSGTFEAEEEATIITSGFRIDTNGEDFYLYLAECQRLFLDPVINADYLVSRIDHFLVLIDGNQATVYVNELQFMLGTIAKRDLKAGEHINSDDIVGVTKLEFLNVPIPNNCGIAFFFSVGWRRGFFFDFRPNQGQNLENIQYILGRCYEGLVYPDIYKVNHLILSRLYQLGWFPFVALLGSELVNFNRLVARINEGKTTEKAESDLVACISEVALKNIDARLQINSLLKPHHEILSKGIERYLAQDYVSSINNIWPRVEGILRYNYSTKSKESLPNLLSNMESTFGQNTDYPFIFLPKQFKDYLHEYYFKDFDLANGQLDVSRHSIGHGVANFSDYDQKRALIGILIADQLAYYTRHAAISTKAAKS